MPDWRTARPEKTNDGLAVDGELVVSAAEGPIQRRLAFMLTKSSCNRVLEMGYGLGLASEALRLRRPREHWIIEGNEWLAKECEANLRSSAGARVTVLNETWEHALDQFAPRYFDSVLFDPYPFEPESGSTWLEKFAYVADAACQPLARIIAQRGRLGFINFDPASCHTAMVSDLFRGYFLIDSISSGWFVEETAAEICILARHNRRSAGARPRSRKRK